MTRVIRLVVAGMAVVLTILTLLAGVTDYVNSGWAFGFVGFLIVGAVILWHRPANLLAWLMVVTGASISILALEQWYVRSPYGPGSTVAEAVFQPLNSLPWIALMLLVVLFPDGRPTTRLQAVLLRVVLVVGSVALVAVVTQAAPMTSRRPNPFYVPWLEPVSSWVMGPGFVMIPLVMLAALVGLVQRWRVSVGERRLQFRWLLWGVGITLLAIPGLFVFSGDTHSVIALLILAAMWAIPVAIGVAVTRYRLYDINQVISRTASYAIVTGLLVGTYALLVTAVTRWLGSQPQWVVAAATLAVAALFRPLLTRVQRVVDRRFNREKYDAQREVERFSTLLTEVVDADRARRELLDVTRRTLGPDRVQLWTADRT